MLHRSQSSYRNADSCIMSGMPVDQGTELVVHRLNYLLSVLHTVWIVSFKQFTKLWEKNQNIRKYSDSFS